MKSSSIIFALVGMFLLCLIPVVQGDSNLVLHVPDWNQPADGYYDLLGNFIPYTDGNGNRINSYPGWCGPTAGADIMGYWEDVMGRNGLADGHNNINVIYPGPTTNTPSFPTNPPNVGTWQQGLWHDGSVEMGWFMDTDGWRSTKPLSFPPAQGGQFGTDIDKVGPGLLAYAAASWTDNCYPSGIPNSGTGISKTAYPNTTVLMHKRAQMADPNSPLTWNQMWTAYKAEINAGHPVEIGFDHWVRPWQRGNDMFMTKDSTTYTIETYAWEPASDGHLVVGVGFIDPTPDIVNGDEYFVCQDNWLNGPAGTGQYVAVPVDAYWQQNVYLWPVQSFYTWVGGNRNWPVDWGESSNWNSNSALPPGIAAMPQNVITPSPSSAGAQVTFGNANSNPNTNIDLGNDDRTVGQITFNYGASTTIQSAQGKILTLDNCTIPAVVTVAGHHTISASIALNSNTNIITTSGGDLLTIDGAVIDGWKGAKGITKDFDSNGMNGYGMLELIGLNSYTGATNIKVGALIINKIDNAGSPSSIGAASTDPTNFILGNGTTLLYTGLTSGSTDRGLTIGDNVSIITNKDLAFNGSAMFSATNEMHLNLLSTGMVALGGQVITNGHFYKTGGGTLQYSAPSGIASTIAVGNADMSYIIQEGSVVIQGADNTTQYNVTNGELVVGDTTPNAVNLTVNGGRLNVGTYLSIGRGNGTTGLSSTLIANGGIITTQHVCMGFDAGVVGFNAAPSLTLKNSSQLNSSSFCYLGESPGSHANIILQDNSQFNFADWVSLGLFGNGTMTVKNNAKFIQSGGACDFNIGDFGTGNLTIQDTATVSAGIMYVGRRQNSNGVINQTGGAVDFNKTYNGINFIGGADPSFQGEENPTNAWGAYNLSGSLSTLSFVGSLHVGNYGIGAFNQTGGAITTSGWWLIGQKAGGYGVYNISAGSLTLSNAGAYLAAGDSGTGTLNISGTGSVDVAGYVGIGLNTSSVGVVNLNGGTLAATDLRCVTPAATALLNFNSGELKANTGAGNANFISALDGVYVWNGGGTIDTNNNDVTINQILAKPTGKGLQSIAVANGGLGYMGAPVVNITTNGSGKGATAVADVTGGMVTGITITNPGVDYAVGDTITVQLLGGGAATPATFGPVALNAGNTSTGGLTKTGLGKLTICGNNTYAGATDIENGTLQLGDGVTQNSSLGGRTDHR